VAVSGSGKLKTILQMVGLGMMIWTYPLYGIPIYEIGTFLLLVSAGLTLYSMYIYLKAAWPALSKSDDLS